MILSRVTAGAQKPPLKSTKSGRAIRRFTDKPFMVAAACVRNAARCRVMAGSLA